MDLCTQTAQAVLYPAYSYFPVRARTEKASQSLVDSGAELLEGGQSGWLLGLLQCRAWCKSQVLGAKPGSVHFLPQLCPLLSVSWPPWFEQLCSDIRSVSFFLP